MGSRGYYSREERELRSELAKKVHHRGFIRAGLVKMKRKCGNVNCRCEREGKKHESYYLSMRIGQKRKMVYVPASMEKEVKEWVKTYKEINKGIDKASEYCLKRLKGV